VWIPPGELRDKRELARTRMVFSAQRTRLKNRLHSIIDKYGYQQKLSDFSDIFGARGRKDLEKVIGRLPEHTRYVSELLLCQLDEVESKIKALEKKMKELFKETEEIKLLQSMPGVGFILAVVIALEIGDIERFGSAEKLAGYSGMTPRVHSSGGKTRYGRTRSDTNHYLKWAFSEAGNSVAVNHLCWPNRHVSILYKRLRERKGHSKAIGAVARHLAEATWWMLSKSTAYIEPRYKHVLSTPV
jgi:transposase